MTVQSTPTLQKNSWSIRKKLSYTPTNSYNDWSIQRDDVHFLQIVECYDKEGTSEKSIAEFAAFQADDVACQALCLLWGVGDDQDGAAGLALIVADHFLGGWNRGRIH